MDESEIIEQVKNPEYQAAAIEKFFQKQPPAVGKRAVFMAGIPGSGKTELVRHMNRRQAVIIEHDQLVEEFREHGYSPEKYYTYRKAGSILVSKILQRCLKKGYSFILDGTLSHEIGLSNIKKAFKQGYHVHVYYVVRSASEAWKSTQDREEKEKRPIEWEGFVDTCEKINPNLLKIFKTYHGQEDFEFQIFDKRNEMVSGEAPYLSNLVAEDMQNIAKILREPYNVGVIKN